MSDPQYRDPRIPPRPDEEPAHRNVVELERSNNAMWGWIAGAVAVLLVLIFVFAGRDSTDTASTPTASPPATTTGSAPPLTPPAATTQAPRPAPSTTGQGSAGQGSAGPGSTGPGGAAR